MRSAPRWILVFICFARFVRGANPEPNFHGDVDRMVPAIVSAVPPEYPVDALKQGLSGSVHLEVIIDDQGNVTKTKAVNPSSPLFAAPAEAAVRHWKFSPATDRGLPIASAFEMELPFRAANAKGKTPAPFPSAETMFSIVLLPRQEARLTTSGGVDYPAELSSRGLRGKVILRMEVSADGKITQTQVIDTTHVAFVLPALNADNWKIEPGHQGELPLASTVEAGVEFSQQDSPNSEKIDILAASGISVNLDAAKLRRSPEPYRWADPVYPYDDLLAGTSGAATVEFSITEGGAVEAMEIRDATKPEFAQAMLASLQVARFYPATTENGLTAVKATWHHVFTPPEIDSTEGKILSQVRANDASLPARGLDQKLTPLFRRSPSYPATLVANPVPGTATIEMIIDATGRTRYTRIKSASQEAFGWAAATAVEQWVFQPPLRHSEPVNVRVEIPISFAVPAEK